LWQTALAPSTAAKKFVEGYYIGLMTGSSVDAIDAALVKFDANQSRLIHSCSTPYPSALRTEVIDLVHGRAASVAVVCALDAQIGKQLALAAMALIDSAGIARDKIRAIGSHGQTVCHQPEHRPAGTMQLGDAAQIVELTGITTVADFRHRDMAAGGQGAPFACAFHAAYLRSSQQDRCVLNLGGIANITVLPADQSAPVIGFDSGPASALLDLWIERHLGEPFDHAGRWAAGGNIERELLNHWLEDSYFAKPPPKSTGRDYFNEHWLSHSPTENCSAQDVQTTLTELTAISATAAVRATTPQTKTLLVCGGGVYNEYLMDRLRAHLPATDVRSTESEGLDPQWMESMMIAWLAARAIHGLPGNIPSVTGAKAARICGAIYPA
jgi:anhydro-N-acetylmuramic acid kinase